MSRTRPLQSRAVSLLEAKNWILILSFSILEFFEPHERQIRASKYLLVTMKQPCYHAIAYAGGDWTASALFKLQSARLPVQNIPSAFSDDDEFREGITAVALRRTEQHYGQTFKNIVYIGDGIWDIHSARKSGYALLVLHRGIKQRSSLRQEPLMFFQATMILNVSLQHWRPLHSNPTGADY